MSRFWRVAAVALAVVAVAVSLGLAGRSQAPSAEQRVRHLTAELRCPVCQGLSVADSTSSTSQAIAADVRTRVLAGQSDQQIRSYYVAHYGQWILLNPPGAVGRLVWMVPIALVLGAAAVLTVALRRWSAGGHTRAPTEADRQLVEQTRRTLAARSAELQ